VNMKGSPGKVLLSITFSWIVALKKYRQEYP